MSFEAPIIRQAICKVNLPRGRQPIPSSNIDNCAAVTLTLPSLATGHTNRPRSSRLLNRQALWQSHQMILSRSPRCPRNQTDAPECGSSSKTFSACAANVLNPRRINANRSLLVIRPKPLLLPLLARHRALHDVHYRCWKLPGTPSHRQRRQIRRILSNAALCKK